MLPIQEAQVQYLVEGLSSHMSLPKKEKKKYSGLRVECGSGVCRDQAGLGGGEQRRGRVLA